MTIAVDWDAEHQFNQTKKLWSKRKLPYEPQWTEQRNTKGLAPAQPIQTISRHASNVNFHPLLTYDYFLQQFKQDSEDAIANSQFHV